MGFAAVRIDTVHENMMEAHLEVPTDDDNPTLRLAQYTKVQWRRSLILTESATPPPPPPPPKRTIPTPPLPPPSGMIIHNQSIKCSTFKMIFPSSQVICCLLNTGSSQKETDSSAPPVPPEAQDRMATSAPSPPQPGIVHI